MPLERYELLLPLKYNDGSPIEPEIFQQTRRELVEKFGAVTVEPQSVHGIWTHKYLWNSVETIARKSA